MPQSLYDIAIAALPPQLAADYAALDRWVDQLIEMHRRAARVGDVDMMLVFSLEMNEAFALMRAYHDLVDDAIRASEAPQPDRIIHEDEEGWWHWTETWAHREGPFPTAHAAQLALQRYVDLMLGA